VLVHDVRLDLAGHDLATVAEHAGAPSHSLIDFALRTHGMIESAQQVVMVNGSANVAGELVSRLGDALFHTNVRIGFGIADHTTIGIIFYASGVKLAPMPRAISTGDTEISGELDPRFRDPGVRVIEHKTTTRLGVTVDEQGHFHATLSCGDRVGVLWISIEAGGTPLVTFPIHCAMSPPTTFKIVPMTDVLDQAEVERRVISIINHERGLVQLAPLRATPHVTAAARQYAARTRTTDEWTNSAVSEVRAANVRDAMEYLINDFDEHLLFASNASTHVGVAAAMDAEHELHILLLYVQIPPSIDLRRATATIADQIRAVQRVAVDVELSEIAQRYAEGHAAGRQRDELWKAMNTSIGMLSHRHRRTSLAVETTFDLNKIDGNLLIRDLIFNAIPSIGIGIGQNQQTGKIWVVVLFEYGP